MLDKTSIRTSVSADFSARFKTDLIAELTANGYTAADLAAVDLYIDNLVGEVTPTSDMGLDEYEVQVEEETTAALTSDYSSKKAAEASKAKSEAVEAHEVFNAKSTITYPEPIFSEPKFTSPVDIQDASYSLTEDYPDSYGMIDEEKNWYKINKTKKHVELVHSSGTQIKIDREGNVTEHIKGNLKRVIEGDYSEEIKGSHDKIVKGDMYTHIVGEVETLMDKTRTHTVNKDSSETVNGEKIEDYKKGHSMNVGADSSETISGSKSIESNEYTLDATTVTLTGATFDIMGDLTSVTSSGLLALKGSPLAFST